MIAAGRWRLSIDWNATPASWRTVRLVLAVAALAAVLAIALLPPLVAVGLFAGIAVTATVMRVPAVGYVLLVISVPWSSVVPLRGAGPLTTTDLLIGLLAGIWLAVSARDRVNPVPRTLWTPYLLFYVAAVILSVTQARDLAASGREVIKWVEVAVVYFSAVRLLRGRVALGWLLGAVVASGVSEALLGYAQFLFQLGPAAFIAHRPFFRSYGTFDQPNPYAGFLNMTLPAAIALALLAEQRWQRRLAGGSSALIGTALLASQSRGGLLAGLLATAVVLGTVRPGVRTALRLLALTSPFAAAAYAFNLLPSTVVDRALSGVGLGGVSFGHVTTANFSAVERAAHWLAGVRMFADRPILGVGIGNYSAAYPRYHPRGWYASLEHAHNYYINIAAEAGIVGLLAYILLIGTALWYSYAAIRQVDSRLSYAALLATLGALTATSFHNLFDVLYVHGMAAMVGLLVALVPISRRLDAHD